jgi:hypothetical protein
MKKNAVRAALAAATVTMLTGVAVAGAAPASATGYAATFVSPSGNISCHMSTYGVRCDIEEAQWREAGCDGHGSGRTVGLNERSGYLCSSDYYETRVGHAETGWWDNDPNGIAVYKNGATQAGLRYGSSISVGEYTCYSEQAGVTCVNHRTGAGFWIAREGYVTV